MSNPFSLSAAIRAVGGNPALVNDIFAGQRNRDHHVPLDAWMPGWSLNLSYSGLGNLGIEILHQPAGAQPERKLLLGYSPVVKRMGLGNPKPDPIPFTWYQSQVELLHEVMPVLGSNTPAMHILERLLEHMNEAPRCIQ